MRTKEIKGRYYSVIFDDVKDCWFINDGYDNALIGINKNGTSMMFYKHFCDISTDIGDIEDIFKLIITVNNYMRVKNEI